MNPKTSVLLAASVLMSLALAPVASAQYAVTFSFLHKFSKTDAGVINSDGIFPDSLARASDGTFYGTTPYGGPNGFGTLYKLSPDGTLTVLHAYSEADATTNGFYAGGVILGSDGNVYGTTLFGGANDNGIIYRCTPDGVYTPLYSLSAIDNSVDLPKNSDGTGPGLAFQDGDGNFYGTTYKGGVNGLGTIFRLTPTGSFTTVYAFGSADGSQTAGTGKSPGSLIQNSDGNLYGTTLAGGANNTGTFFRLTPGGTLTTLFDFSAAAPNYGDGPVTNSTGYMPGVGKGNDGNFYGIASRGGSTGDGTFFRITPTGAFTLLHTFSGADGSAPTSLVQGNDGNFYGLVGLGDRNSSGTLFQITPAGVLTDVYDFGSDLAEVYLLLLGSDGNFYGVSEYTPDAGDNNGTVFELMPTPPPAFFTGEVDLGNGVYYLSFANSNIFGYYSFLADPHYIYHFDLGYEYVFDAADGHGGVYFYDFKSNDFFYTSPTFPFPYLYDFGLNSTVYYYPDPSHAGRYNTNGLRYFYDFATGKIISK